VWDGVSGCLGLHKCGSASGHRWLQEVSGGPKQARPRTFLRLKPVLCLPPHIGGTEMFGNLGSMQPPAYRLSTEGSIGEGLCP
jgi:hypothetical protein